MSLESPAQRDGAVGRWQYRVGTTESRRARLMLVDEQMDHCVVPQLITRGAWCSGIFRVRGIASAGSKANNLRSTGICDPAPPKACPIHEMCYLVYDHPLHVTTVRVKPSLLATSNSMCHAKRQQ